MNEKIEHSLATSIAIGLTFVLFGWIAYTIWQAETTGNPGLDSDPLAPNSIEQTAIRAAAGM